MDKKMFLDWLACIEWAAFIDTVKIINPHRLIDLLDRWYIKECEEKDCSL